MVVGHDRHHRPIVVYPGSDRKRPDRNHQRTPGGGVGGNTPGGAVNTPSSAINTPGSAVDTPGGALKTPGGAAVNTPSGAVNTPGSALNQDEVGRCRLTL